MCDLFDRCEYACVQSSDSLSSSGLLSPPPCLSADRVRPLRCSARVYVLASAASPVCWAVLGLCPCTGVQHAESVVKECVCVCVHPCVCHPQAELLESEVLLAVERSAKNRFLDAVTRSWRLRWSSSVLLYRGSRDGMTPAAFHAACDRKGPTLTLIRADSGFTFGGYTSTPWDSVGAYTACPDAFLFCVAGPHCLATKFPLVVGEEGKALLCAKGTGPAFGCGDLWVLSGSGAAGALFDDSSSCTLGKTYEDVLALYADVCVCVCVTQGGGV